jgi:hypothetical protein
VFHAHGRASRHRKKRLTQAEAALEGLESRRSTLAVAELRWQSERAQAQREHARRQLAELDRHGVDHLHPQEVEARVMTCDARLRLAYNAQAVADHEHDLIVALGLTADAHDHAQLVPMLQQVQRTLERVADQTVADTGYFSGEQLQQARQQGLPVLVQEQTESDKGLLPKSSFRYDDARDVYICPRGELLPLRRHSHKSPHATSPTAIYRCRSTECPERRACSRDPKGRSIQRNPTEPAVLFQRDKLARPAMRTLYALRKEIIEHQFGCIKSNEGFWRFTVRGAAKALAQWTLACMALNLRKLVPAWRTGILALPTRSGA